MTSADSEVTPADMRARIAEVADVIRTTPDVCGDPRCPECAAHLASALLASFVVVPKDQLHQQWRTLGFMPSDEEMARRQADHLGGGLQVRWMGSWRPA